MSLFGNTGSTTGFGQSTSTPSLFGPPQQQQTGSIFGAQPAKSGGLFGSTTTGTQFGAAPPAGSTLFGGGQQQQQPATSSLFGSGQQQQQQPATGGLFGSTPQQPAAGGTGSIFGSTQPAAGGTGLFGSTPAQPAAGGGLFGSTTTQQQQQQQPASGLFGTQQPAAGTSSLFGGGQQQQQQQQPATGGLFGGAPAAGTSSLFGSTAQPAAGSTGGLFGQSTQAPAVGSSIFGNTSTQPVAGGALFGSAPTATGSLFGQQPQQQQQQQSSFFGQQPQQQQPQASSSFFGSTSAPTTGLFNSTSASSFRPAASGVGGQDPAAQQMQLLRQMEGIYKAWSTQSPDCAFQHFFYNLVDPAQAPLYRRPDNWTNTPLWERALRENPDPTCMVPVLALGFEDLQRRVAAQDKTKAEHEAKLTELSTRLEALSQKHVLSNAVRAARARTMQAQLSARLIKLVQHLHLLIPSVRSSAIRPEEEALRAALEAIEDELKRPGGMGRVRGKLNELWALVSAVSAQHERERRARPDGPGWAVADQEGLQRIQQILKEQQHGLAHVISILKQDERDVAIMQTGGTAANLPSNASFNASQNSLAASMMLRR